MIARMDRVEILCLRNRLREMTTTLQEAGLLHIEEVPTAMENVPGFLRRAHPDPEQTQKLFQLEELDRLLRESEPLLTVKPGYDEVAAAAKSLPELGSDASLDKARAWSEELRELARQRASLRDNLEVLANYRRMLENIEPVLGHRQVRLGHGARAVILQGDVQRAVPLLEEGVKRAVQGDVEVIAQLVGKKTVAAMILYPETEDAAVTRVLLDQGINPMDLPDKSMGGLPVREVMQRIDKTLASQRRELAEIEQKLDAASRQHGAALTAMQRVVADRLSEIKVVDSFAESELIAVIQGWVPHAQLPEIERIVEQRFGSNAHLAVLPLDDVDRKQVPTLLYNPKWFRPFEVLLKLFKPPTYGTLDPSAMVGIAFLLFYGFIVGDMGYGISIILFGLFLQKKWGRNELVKYAGIVAVYAGVSTCFFGFIYGEFFGDLPERYLGIHPIFHRAHHTTAMLVLAILVGVVHIYMSLVIAVWENFRLGHKHHGEEKLGMLIGLTGVLLGVGGAALLPNLTIVAVVLAILFLVAAAAILFKAARWFMPLHMLEIISLVANIVSYSRLMALGVAGIALADLANSMLGGSGIGLLIGIFGAFFVHLLNLGISMFSPMLHSLRLNYVEFLSKFYAPEGKSYQPFKKEALW
jgi:V/A-type H+-transporting ATPase subunit I